MGREDIIRTISREFNLDETDIYEFWDSIFNTISESLAKGKNVNISEFGKFIIFNERDENFRIIKNIRFIPVRKFFDEVNKDYRGLTPVRVRMLGINDMLKEEKTHIFPKHEVEAKDEIIISPSIRETDKAATSETAQIPLSAEIKSDEEIPEISLKDITSYASGIIRDTIIPKDVQPDISKKEDSVTEPGVIIKEEPLPELPQQEEEVILRIDEKKYIEPIIPHIEIEEGDDWKVFEYQKILKEVGGIEEIPDEVIKEKSVVDNYKTSENRFQQEENHLLTEKEKVNEETPEEFEGLLEEEIIEQQKTITEEFLSPSEETIPPVPETEESKDELIIKEGEIQNRHPVSEDEIESIKEGIFNSSNIDEDLKRIIEERNKILEEIQNLKRGIPVNEDKKNEYEQAEGIDISETKEAMKTVPDDISSFPKEISLTDTPPITNGSQKEEAKESQTERDALTEEDSIREAILDSPDIEDDLRHIIEERIKILREIQNIKNGIDSDLGEKATQKDALTYKELVSDNLTTNEKTLTFDEVFEEEREKIINELRNEELKVFDKIIEGEDLSNQGNIDSQIEKLEAIKSNLLKEDGSIRPSLISDIDDTSPDEDMELPPSSQIISDELKNLHDDIVKNTGRFDIESNDFLIKGTNVFFTEKESPLEPSESAQNEDNTYGNDIKDYDDLFRIIPPKKKKRNKDKDSD